MNAHAPIPNPFEALADTQIVAPVKQRLKAAEARASRAAEAEKELRDEEKLGRLYRRWRRQKVEDLLTGSFGREVKGLLGFVRTMTLSSAPALIRLVEQATWIQAMPLDARFDLLQEISRLITLLRLREGLPPFDDDLPGEEPKAFFQIKDLMGVR
ncbi:MAG TPA: hypothetical protein VHL98_10980 [Microvirga sp.]|jgi:hypothetical protein|nr:hypothetical protein [Microvirga sp.]